MNINSVMTSSDRIQRAQNAREALELRLQGLTFDQIGARMGFSRQRAHAIVAEELARVNAERSESAVLLRNIEAERLDRLLAAVWPMASVGILTAVDRVLRIMERRARLLGLDVQPNALTAIEARDLVRGLVEAVKSVVTDSDTLRRIKARLGEVVGGTLPGVAGDPLFEVDEETESGSDLSTYETLVDPG